MWKGGKGMEFCTVYCTPEMQMDSLQKWILVHSVIYYELNQNIVRDSVFDKNCKQLVGLMEEYPETVCKTRYCYCMYDFDGTTGFDLYHRLNKADKEELMHTAKYILKLCK